VSHEWKKIGVGVIGLGTVGTGVVRILLSNAEEIRRRLGIPLDLIKIADLDIQKDRGVPIESNLLTTRAEDVVDHPEIQIVVELIGGYQPAKDLILKSISRGKSVVTANKALLAEHGEEIWRVAEEKGVDLGFEASVGGGIPIIRAIREGLAANRFQSVYGIINGTANYILTKMTEEGRPFEEVLREAQAAGYAESNPSLDVDGQDTAHKLCILVTLCFGTPVEIKSIHTEGISAISTTDIAFAKELGFRVKLLAIAKQAGSQIEARVHPTLIAEDHLISTVRGVFNAVYIVGDAVGETLFYGKGAGEMPTASAVVGDVIEAARNLIKGAAGRVPVTGYHARGRKPLEIKPMETIECAYYLRFMALDKPGVLSKISGVLGSHQISLSSVLQKTRHAGHAVPVVMMTHRAVERNIRSALREIDSMPDISEKTCLIRVEGEE
jgi:homoserine dehydrogenase